MQELNRAQTQKISLEILKYVADLAEKNNLKYSLAWGTLIGAVRHNGFIPWDDDIDIIMPREDYMKMMEMLVKQEGKYQLYSIYNKENYYYSVSRVIDTDTIILGEKKKVPQQCDCGVFIDIYPLDYMGDTIEEATKTFNEIVKTELLKFMALTPKFEKARSGLKTTLLKVPVYFGCKIMGYKYFENKCEKQSLKIKKSAYVGCWAGNGGFQADKLVFDGDLFEETIPHAFENYVFKIPKNYDTILRQVYGNYMELPPKEDQIGHHEYKAYLK